MSLNSTANKTEIKPINSKTPFHWRELLKNYIFTVVWPVIFLYMATIKNGSAFPAVDDQACAV